MRGGQSELARPIPEEDTMKRIGQVIALPPENLEEYRRLHAEVWPEVLDMIRKCNMRNYSIFYRDGMLYAYFEYVGDDYEADMRKMAADPKTQEWWAICGPLQRPLEDRAPGEWWAHMEGVFHTD